jgi:CrcB protein
VTLAALSALVAAGGAAGALGRFWVGLAAASWLGSGWPFGTLAVNVVGSFGIGVVASGSWASETVRAAVVTGLLGGFTTFSAFSLETVRMIEAGRTGQALGYVAAQIVLCLAAAALGVLMARMLSA